MTNSANKYKETITGKATTMQEVQAQCTALTLFKRECHPVEDELALYESKVNAAAKAFSAILRAERISALLDLGTGAEFWKSFISDRDVKAVTIRYNKKTATYEAVEKVRKDDMSFDEVDAAYVERETKRLEAEGKTAEVDAAALTIAASPTFKTLRTGVYGKAFAFIAAQVGNHDNGKKAAYGFVDRKGDTVNDVKIPSIGKLQECVTELTAALLPANFIKENRVFFQKCYIKALAISTVDVKRDRIQNKNDNFATTWFLNQIRNVMNNEQVKFTLNRVSADDING